MRPAEISQMPRACQTLGLKDGRLLGFAEYGDPFGRPAFYFHGWPSSRLEAAPADQLARRMAVNLISVDRPGCGLSDHKPGRTLHDWPADVAQLADHRKVERFAVIGNSGGAPYAAACAAKIPERVTELLILCGLGPTDQRACVRPMMLSARFAICLARHAPRLAAWLAMFALRRLARPNVVLFPESTLGDLPECDRIALRKAAVRSALSAAVREAFRSGIRGPAWDGCVYAQRWPFNPLDIHAPTRLWHGEQDTIVPVEMGRFYAHSIPRCEATFYPDEGHFSLPFNRMEEIFDTVCAGD